MKRLIFLGLIFIIGLRAFSADYVDNINSLQRALSQLLRPVWAN